MQQFFGRKNAQFTIEQPCLKINFYRFVYRLDQSDRSIEIKSSRSSPGLSNFFDIVDTKQRKSLRFTFQFRLFQEEGVEKSFPEMNYPLRSARRPSLSDGNEN
jgi:hypothetical protein